MRRKSQGLDHGNGDTTKNNDSSECSTIAPKETITSSVSLSFQDFEVYGKLNTQLADLLAESIEAAISKGVDSLPLLDDDCYRGSQSDAKTKSPKERLRETLRYKFVRNVDVLEAYCAHHLFTLRKHPPARRKRIVSVLQGGPQALPVLSPRDHVSDETSTKKYPTRSELYTNEDRYKLSEDLSRLKTDLENARKRRNELKAAIAAGGKAETVVDEVVTTVAENAPPETMEENLSKAVEESRTVGQLTEEAKSMTEKLDGIKRGRSSQNTNIEEDTFDFEQQDDPLYRGSFGKRQKALTPMEAYYRDQRELGLLKDTTNIKNCGNQNGLDILKEMLRAPRVSPNKSTH